MSHKLFLICPFSQMEPFLIKQYGTEIYFATAMGSVFRYHDPCYLNFFEGFIKKNNISELFIVVETSCRFLNSILNQDSIVNSHAENVMRSLYLNNYKRIYKQETLQSKQRYLAELLIDHQAKELLKIPQYTLLIDQNVIQLKGLLTSRLDGNRVEINNLNSNR